MNETIKNAIKTLYTAIITKTQDTSNGTTPRWSRWGNIFQFIDDPNKYMIFYYLKEVDENFIEDDIYKYFKKSGICEVKGACYGWGIDEFTYDNKEYGGHPMFINFEILEKEYKTLFDNVE